MHWPFPKRAQSLPAIKKCFVDLCNDEGEATFGNRVPSIRHCGILINLSFYLEKKKLILPGVEYLNGKLA